ncbi:MAG: MSMEG_1061 family FMN-dependent PPOX-type flavoprotein [Planctomycetota bacterium]|nr:MSMEG_1061 family FMN-dependent PPOX-type flavoprotein [Planctomycetota bacterium]
MTQEQPRRIDDPSALRELYDAPSQLSQQKFLTELDPHCVAIIQHSSFYCLATAHADGSLDVSPRGDPPGSVVVIDPKTLLLPDRRGNNRLDSLTNATERPHVALLFLVPGVLETLRVSGTAEIVQGDSYLAETAIAGQTPTTGMLVRVTKTCLQCGKAVKRSALWEETYRIERDRLASFGTMLADQTQTDQTATELDQSIDDAYQNRLY